MTEQTEQQVARELVARIVQGDKQAEQHMVERYQRGLLFMLNRKAQNQTLAEDIAQETWRIVIEKVRADAIKEPEKLSAFIVQTAKNQLIMHFRNPHHNKMDHDEEAVERIEDSSAQPEKLLEKHNLTLMVRQLVNELKTPRDRELIFRFYIAEESKSHICDDLGLNDLHFNRVLFRARQRFKEIWNSYTEMKSP